MKVVTEERTQDGSLNEDELLDRYNQAKADGNKTLQQTLLIQWLRMSKYEGGLQEVKGGTQDG